MASITNGDLTTKKHHVFFLEEGIDDYWLYQHLEIMESQGFRVAAMSPFYDGTTCIIMTKE